MKSTIFSTFLLLLVLSLAQAIDQRLCTCRQSAIGRITNGRKATNLAYPWIVSLQTQPQNLREAFASYSHVCVANILNENYVLTAAHCVSRVDTSKMRIAYGSNKDLRKMTNYVGIAEVIIHDDYNAGGDRPSNDLAIIRTSSPIKFFPGVLPACLNGNRVSQYPSTLNIAGFGSIGAITLDTKTKESRGYVPTYTLMEGDVQDATSSHPACADASSKRSLICVDNQSVGTNACKGDSGGGVHFNLGGKSYLIGTLSFANHRFVDKEHRYIKICDSGAGYTRLSEYMRWIQQEIGFDYCSI